MVKTGTHPHTVCEGPPTQQNVNPNKQESLLVSWQAKRVSHPQTKHQQPSFYVCLCSQQPKTRRPKLED